MLSFWFKETQTYRSSLHFEGNDESFRKILILKIYTLKGHTSPPCGEEGQFAINHKNFNLANKCHYNKSFKFDLK